MGHTPHNTLQDLVNDIKTEDHEEYLKILNHINTQKLEGYILSSYIINCKNNLLTDNQLELLKVLKFTRGNTIRMYTSYGNNLSLFEKRWGNIKSNINIIWGAYDLTIQKEDLKYVSTYTITKWKQENPTRTQRKAKGSQHTFNMDEFSLNIFKNSITKHFLRTEAKNYVIKVNKAFKNTKKTPKDISIRNRFYALILNNTEVHTKAMLNELQYTDLQTEGTNGINYYSPHPEEALVITLGWQNNNLKSLNTIDSQESYSTDTNICTHMNPINEPRIQKRMLAAASCMATLASKLNSDTYNNLAAKMVSNLDQDLLTEAQELTESAAILNKIIKEIK